MWLVPALVSTTPLYAETGTAATGTAGTEPKTVAPLVTADAVQEAFVRVADRLKLSVVTIQALRNPKVADSKAGGKPDGGKPDKTPDKNPNGKKPNSQAPDGKAPKVTPPAPFGDPGGDEGDDEGDAPFGPSPFGPRDPHERMVSLGTGMVVSADGYILTNYHVVKGSNFVRVLFNADSERPDQPAARVVGFDEESDMAVLKVERTGLHPVEFADSDSVRIGEWAIAIGAPFDQAQTVTVGVVSAKGRHLESKNTMSLQDYIQTDASINPGNSGGPLIDLEGKVMGINTAILSPSRFNVGIGFAVPSNTVRTYLPTLLSGKTIARGFLGIQYVRIDENVAKEFGVTGGMQIGALAQGKDGTYVGPAKEAGLQEGDIITGINGQPVNSSEEFRRIVSATPPGQKMEFTVVRPTGDHTEKLNLTVTLGDRTAQDGGRPRPTPGTDTPNPNASRLGLETENADKLTDVERQRFSLDASARGAVITDVVPGSPADDAQLSRGLRIVRARASGEAWQQVPNKATFARIEKALAPGARLLLQLRDDKDVSVYKLIVVPAK